MEGTDKKQKFLAFEGVRAEESTTRSEYNRIGKGVKHKFVVNARPILNWSTTEVFLYLFEQKLHINSAYRVGKPRVGCILCPFGSPWDDMIVNSCYPNNLKPFLEKIEKSAESRKIPNKAEYISERKWKLRGSGKFTDSNTSVSFNSDHNKWQAVVENAEKDLFTWLPVIGKYTIKEKPGSIIGELDFKKEIYTFEVIFSKDSHNYKFALYDNNNIQLRYYLRRIINKSAYCINCEACELECPTGALSVYPNICIDKEKCVHCYKCLEYHNVGCIVADSMIKPSTIKLTNMKISKYGTFGIHQEWVDQYLTDPETFWDERILGIKQIPSFKAWLKDAEIVDDKVNLTPFGELCVEINKENATLLWEIIYINLVYNSPLVKWFSAAINFNTETSRKDLDKLAIEYFQQTFKKTTITYAIQALVQTFKYSPIGEDLLLFVCQDAKGTVFQRLPYNDLSPEAVAYSLYKYAQEKGIKMLRVSDLYRPEEECGLYKEFGISKTDLQKKLRFLSSDKNRVLVAELAMGLDHITLRDDLNAITALKTLLA